MQRSEDKPGVIQLEETLNISRVESLHERLSAARDGGGDITLVGDAVQRADAATLQLFWAFRKSLGDSEASMLWENPSAALCHAAEMVGLSDALGLPATADMKGA